MFVLIETFVSLRWFPDEFLIVASTILKQKNPRHSAFGRGLWLSYVPVNFIIIYKAFDVLSTSKAKWDRSFCLWKVHSMDGGLVKTCTKHPQVLHTVKWKHWQSTERVISEVGLLMMEKLRGRSILCAWGLTKKSGLGRVDNVCVPWGWSRGW
jgi:hypothetical protein